MSSRTNAPLLRIADAPPGWGAIRAALPTKPGRAEGFAGEAVGLNGSGVEMSLGTRRPAASARGAAGPGGLTILVADDEPEVRATVGRVLRTQGYHVLEAADGVQALEVAARHSGPIHLLLTDIEMPRLDGRELHCRLNHQRPETRTLFMSGSLDTGLHPADAFLPKPFFAGALVRKVCEVLQIRELRA